MIDLSIIASVKSRDKGAFKLLYQSCIGYVYTIVRRYITNESDHKDVIQEIFARVFLSIHTFNPSKGDFKFWLRRLVINQCMQHYRQGKSPAMVVPISSIEEKVEEQLTGLSKVEIEQALGQMPEGYRQVFMLVVIDDYSHKEVGALLNISADTSRSQFSRAKGWLRKHVSQNKLKTLVNGL